MFSGKTISKILMILFLFLITVGCQYSSEPTSLTFEPLFSSDITICESDSAKTILSDLRVFIHDVEVFSQNKWGAVELVSQSPWQTAHVALLDFENGQGACKNGSANTNHTLLLNGNLEAPKKIRFKIGVPFELNHANPSVAPVPLNISSMHWHWQSGYKFMRMAIENNGIRSWFHLGSTGCEGVVGDIKHCVNPNRFQIELPIDKANKVQWDLSTLITSLLLDTEESRKCMSSPQDEFCHGIFEALKSYEPEINSKIMVENE